MCRAPRPNRRGSLSAATASRTRSRFSSGSPMPMNTMFVSRLPSSASDRAAWRTWSRISAVSRSRSKPSSPVAQNGQPTAQPACDEMHSVCRSRGAAARRVVHEHRLDEPAVRERVQPLLGQAAVGQADVGVGDGVEAERAVQGGAERRRAASGPRRTDVAPERHTASRTWRARYAGSPRSANQATSSRSVRPAMPGRGSRGADRAGARGHDGHGQRAHLGGHAAILARRLVPAGVAPARAPASALRPSPWR